MENSFLEKIYKLFNEEKYQEAYKECNRALKIESNNSEIYQYKGLCEMQLGHFLEAVIEFEQAIHFSDGEDDAFLYFLKGRGNYLFGWFDKAMKDFDKAIELDDTDPDFFKERGEAKVKHFNLLESGIEDFMKAKELEQIKKDIAKNLLEEETELNLTIENISRFEITSLKRVNKVLDFANSGIELLNSKKYKKALKIFESITQNMNYKDHYIEYFVDLFFYKGLCKYHLYQYDQANKDISFAIKISKKYNQKDLDEYNTSGDYYLLLASIYERQGVNELAIKSLDKFIGDIYAEDYFYENNDAQEYVFCRAKLKKHSGKFKSALSDVFALIHSPDLVTPENIYAEYCEFAFNLCLILKDYEQANNYRENVLNIKSSDKKVLFLQGQLLLENKLPKNALTRFKKVKKYQENYPYIDYQINRSIFLDKNTNQFNFDRFKRTSIINYKFRNEMFINDFDSNDHKSFADLKKILSKKYFSNTTKLNEFRNLKNWHINDSLEYKKFLKILKNIPRFSQYRSFEELCELIQIIIDEKIDLFIIKKDKSGKYLALYDPNQKFIVINGNYFYDIDRMCISLSHELIHYYHFYLQKDEKPLGLEIEDSIVPEIFGNETYSNLSNIAFHCELEAWTYESVPYFIIDYRKNREQIIEKYKISPQRAKTIEWIVQNRFIPIYGLNSFPRKKIKFNYFKN